MDWTARSRTPFSHVLIVPIHTEVSRLAIPRITGSGSSTDGRRSSTSLTACSGSRPTALAKVLTYALA